ncbi:MAG: ABC transporter permease [Oscillospiraceae bacterium]|nr:ABC transporter permease [Oscillospiraceae bacterium]
MKKSWLSRCYVGLVMFFLYVPIFVLIVYSFNENKSRGVWTGFSFKCYRELFHNEIILQSLSNTLFIAVVSSILATLLGTAAAIGIFSMSRKARSLVMNVTYFPIINPEIVTGVSLMLLFAMCGIDLGYLTLIIAHMTFCTPYVILNVLPKLRQMDSHIYEAALDLGCSPLQAFYKVIIPEIMPGILSGLMMSFTYSLDDFIISYFVSSSTSQTLPITIYSMTRRKVSPEINALSAIIFVVVLVILIAVNVYGARQEKQQQKRYASYL